jgi:hypothetical protein
MKRLLFLSVLIILTGCASGIKEISFEGDQAEIILRNKSTFDAELLMVSDSGLFVIRALTPPKVRNLKCDKIFFLPYVEVFQVRVEGYTNHGWVAPVIIFQAVPAVLFTTAAYSAGAELNSTGALILFGIPALTAILFASSEPDPPGYTGNITEDQKKELQKYTRYPGGLTDMQFGLLLKKHGREKSLRASP